jgi:membrane carboxypeptidase/penicillin-binding protein PbpC
VLYENKIHKERIMSEETAYLMTDMLVSGVKNGTSHKLSTLPFEVAGKTGTVGLHGKNKNSDAWSIGYTSKNTVGVWFGNSTGQNEMHLESSNNGGTYASMLLRDILDVAHKEEKPIFGVPNNIVFCNIDEIALNEEHSVKLAGNNVPQMYQIKEVFNKKFAPKQVSSSFESLNRPNLSLEVSNNKVLLSFDALSYYSYEIYKVHEDETILFDTISNKKDKVTLTDDNLEEDVLYEYYLIAKQVNYADNFEVKSAKSNSVKALISEKIKQDFVLGDQEKEVKKKKRFILF